MNDEYKVVSTGVYDELQQALTVELMRVIREELEKVDAPSDIIKQLTGSIAFSVASVLDDVAGFESNDMAVSPVVTFCVGENELECSGGNSWMHEYVYRLLPKVFDEQKPN